MFLRLGGYDILNLLQRIEAGVGDYLCKRLLECLDNAVDAVRRHTLDALSEDGDLSSGCDLDRATAWDHSSADHGLY